MTFEQYQEAMKRTASDLALNKENLALGAMGLAGEAGEVADYIKKVVFHKHELSHEEIAKELGDVLWYLTYIASITGFTLSEIAEINIEKLMRRYPNGWDVERSINREDNE